jgi:GT2 family glycosyltransferase
MSTKEKIFVGITTCNRSDFFNQCYNSIKNDKNIDIVAVVNDGKEEINVDTNIHYIKHDTNKGVSISKNDLFRYALEQNAEHIFILEDDCQIIDSKVWELYIDAYKKTGIKHFNFGPGSPWNRVQEDPSIIGNLSLRHLAKQNTPPNPKLIVEYTPQLKIAMYTHIVGMFSYFHSSVLKEVGLFDETFYNAWEHVEHTYRIIKAKKYTPFWWFADVHGSENYIKEAQDEKAKSSLAKNEEQFMKQTIDGLNHFYKLHNTVPSQIPPVSKEEVIKTLKEIYDNRSKN